MPRHLLGKRSILNLLRYKRREDKLKEIEDKYKALLVKAADEQEKKKTID